MLLDKVIDVEGVNISEAEGYARAMRAAKSATEGELRFYLAYNPDGQSHNFKCKQAIARSELERRAFSAQRWLVVISSFSGIAGVIVGSIITVLAK